MDSFLSVFQAAIELFQRPMNIYGFTFSFWEIMIFSVVAGLAIKFVVGLID